MRTGRGTAAVLLAPTLALGLSLAPGRSARFPTPDVVVSLLHADQQASVEAGLMAQRRGRSEGVRRLGRVLERDGRLADARVMSLARAQGLRVGEQPRGGEDRAMLVRLEGVPDAQFDAEFLLALSRRRARELEELARARRTPDRRLGRLVDRLAPVLEQQESLARRLAAGPGGNHGA